MCSWATGLIFWSAFGNLHFCSTLCACEQQRLLQDYAFQQVYLLSACQILLCWLICCGYLNKENHFTETILLNTHNICAGLHSAVVDMCLTKDMCLTADPGVASLIPALSHTFIEIDHEIISAAILLPLIQEGLTLLSV